MSEPVKNEIAAHLQGYKVEMLDPDMITRSMVFQVEGFDQPFKVKHDGKSPALIAAELLRLVHEREQAA